MDSLSFAFNAIMPIILLILLGYVLTNMHFLTPEFLKVGNKFVFRVALPLLLFMNVYSIGSFSEIDASLIVYCALCILALFAAGLVIALFFIKDDRQKGVILQCVFRSNFAIIGIPLAETLGGTAAKAQAAVLSAVSIPMFNILAVISLSVFVAGKGADNLSLGKKIKNVLVNILKNPLIIGVVSGLIALVIRSFIPTDATGNLKFSLSVSLPFLYSAIKSLSNVATPLALVIMGGNFDFKTTKGAIREIGIATLFRVVIAPLFAIGLGVFLSAKTGVLHFDKTVYPSLVALFGTPVAVSSAIMAEQMDNDGKLAAQLVVWTSLLSIVTIFTEIAVLRSFGLL